MGSTFSVSRVSSSRSLSASASSSRFWSALVDGEARDRDVGLKGGGAIFAGAQVVQQATKGGRMMRKSDVWVRRYWILLVIILLSIGGLKLSSVNAQEKKAFTVVVLMPNGADPYYHNKPDGYTLGKTFAALKY